MGLYEQIGKVCALCLGGKKDFAEIIYARYMYANNNCLYRENTPIYTARVCVSVSIRA